MSVKVLLMIVHFMSTNLANARIENGTDLQSDSSYYSFVTTLKKKSDQLACTATYISPNLILTAAHCVTGDKGEPQLDELFLKEKVDQIVIHPRYEAFVKNNIKKKLETSSTHQSAEERYDLAIIKLKDNAALKFVGPYPKIINENTVFVARGDFTLVGGGAKSTVFDAIPQRWLSAKIPEKSELCLGTNRWAAPFSAITTLIPKYILKKNQKTLHMDTYELPRFEQTFSESISEDSRTDQNTHIVTTNTPNKSSALPGDSGAPIFEKDKSGNQILTSILVMGDHKTKNYKFTLKTDKGTETFEIANPKSTDTMISADTPCIFIPEVAEELKKRGLLTKRDKLLDGVTVTRTFDRTTTNWAADLLLPENQKFINSILGKKPPALSKKNK